MFRPKRLPPSSPPIRSDRSLIAALARDDTSALGQLYDRYAPIMYAVTRQSYPAAAEWVVEQVFIDLWTAGRRTLLTTPLMPVLLDLATCALARSPEPPVLTPHAGYGQDALSLLVQRSRAEPLVWNVLVLLRLGSLTIAQCAAILEVEPTVVRHALASGLDLLRQLQPLDRAVGTQVLERPIPSTIFSAA